MKRGALPLQVLPFYTCDGPSLAALLSTEFLFQRDGLLFFHKEATYGVSRAGQGANYLTTSMLLVQIRAAPQPCVPMAEARHGARHAEHRAGHNEHGHIQRHVNSASRKGLLFGKTRRNGTRLRTRLSQQPR